MRYVLLLLVLSLLGIPCTAQETEQFESRSGTLAGYLIETALTPESYIIADTPQMEAFVMMLPKVTPYKTLPATPNPDRFLNGYIPSFEQELLVVAVGRDRIDDWPVFRGVEIAEDGARLVLFDLPKRSAKTFPYGWGVYTAVVIPRSELETRVVITRVGQEDEEFQRADFKSAKFKRL